MVPFAAALLLLSFLEGGTPDESLLVKNTQYGFQVERPDATWRSLAAEDQGEAKYSLTLFPKGSQGVPSVVVYVAKWDGKKSNLELRDAAVTKLASTGAKDIETFDRKIDGSNAACVEGKSSKPGLPDFYLEYDYVSVGATMFILQSAWAADAGRTPPGDVSHVLASFKAIEVAAPVVDPLLEKARDLAKRCGSEVRFAKDWTEASARATAEGKLILAVFEVYRMIAVPRTTPSGIFMDPDLVALIDERFVPMRIEADTVAPFRAEGAYGMGPSSFGTAFYCVDAAGEVVAETSVYDISYLDEFLRGILAARNAFAVKETLEATSHRDGPEALAIAQVALRSGDLALAEKTIDGSTTKEARRIRAQILRRERRGNEALSELDGVPDSDADRALVLMRLGRLEESREAFLRVAAKSDDPRRTEAEFWLGAMDVLRAGWPNGTERWRRLVADSESDRFAWKAAANLAAIGAFINGAERLSWPDADSLASIAPSPRSAVSMEDPKEIERTEKEAVQYLVRMQRADGTWVCPMDAFGFDSNLYTPSVTAACGMALLPFRSDPAARGAVERALARTLESLRAGALDARSGAAGPYTIWGRVFATWFVARASQAGLVHGFSREELRAPLEELVKKVVASQMKSGGWPYIAIAGDEAGNGFDPSASFLTAGALLALIEARASGAAIADGAVDRAVAFLEEMRDPDGVFRYMPDLPNTRVLGRAPEAAGRGPACALAVLRASNDRSRGVAEIEQSLRFFIEEQDRFGRAFHKALCHTEPEGFGAHYLMYDYWLALVATRELDAKESASARTQILAAMGKHRFADGSFEDLPGIGRAAATALALLGMKD